MYTVTFQHCVSQLTLWCCLSLQDSLSLLLLLLLYFVFSLPVLFCCSDPVSPSGINKHHLLSLSASFHLTNATNAQEFVPLKTQR